MGESEAKELVELLRTSPCVTADDRRFWLESLPRIPDGSQKALKVLSTLRRERDAWENMDEDWQRVCLANSKVATFIGSINYESECSK